MGKGLKNLSHTSHPNKVWVSSSHLMDLYMDAKTLIYNNMRCAFDSNGDIAYLAWW